MNRYPLWRYLLIVFALVTSVLYTLPNFFGEVPAVQISSLRITAKIDTSLMATVEKTLKDHALQLDGMYFDPNSIKARFRDTDTQLKAKDALDQALNPDRENPTYILALNLISDSPRWFTAINALPMYLGLDLRGGIHFLLQVDLPAALTKRIDGQVGAIRSGLREKKMSYASIAREGQSVVIKFRDADTRDKAEREISKIAPDLALKTTEAPAEFRITATLTQPAQTETQKSAIEQNITTLRNRINELGVAEPIIQQQGAERIVVQLPGVQDTARAKDILGRTASLEVRMVEAHASDPAGRDYDPAKIEAAIKGNIPFGTELFYERRSGANAEPLLLSKQVIITGERLTKAAPTFDQRDQRPVVSIELDSQGARIMRDVTREAVKRRMAVLLVEKGKPEVITAPTIQDQLGGNFQITGSKTPREANDLALLLRAGALAAPMDIIEERTVGPSLGAENIAIGFHSTWIGFTAIAVFMIAYYMVFGVISIVALAINVLFLVALLSMLQATLTLPGIAGIALTVGMAVDANVLIFERIREELRNGNSPHASIHAGYERAFTTICDSNITTLISALFLFAIGTGPIKGFAVTLSLGIICSMFTAITVTRALVNLIFAGRRLTSLPI